MIRRALVVLAAALILLSAPAGAADKTEPLFKQAKADYQALLKAEARRTYRHNWQRIIDRFLALQRKHPKSPFASDSLFMAAGAYEELHRYSQAKDDLTQSVKIYDRLVKTYPKSEFADDALLHAGAVLEKLGRRDEALAKYEACVKNYAKSDSAPKAKAAQKRLAPKAGKATPSPTPPPAPSPTPSPVPAPTTSPTPTPPVEPAPVDDTVEAPEETAAPVIKTIDHWSTPEYTRIVIETTGRVPFEHHLLEKDPAGNLPRRLYVDFTGTVLDPALSKEVPIQDGLLKRARAGQYQENVSRVVLDIESIGNYTVFPLVDPFRVVIDVTSEKAPAPKGTPTPKPQRWTIVVDPGHGGTDPGAMSRGGDREALLVLAIAKKVEQELAADPRIRVVMTRSTDVFIPLPQRTAIANTARADLFVSIHINASANRSAYGLETYHFSPRARKEDRELVAAENATALESVVEMDDILAALNISSKQVESNALATMVQRNTLTQTTRLFADVPSRKVHSAPFYVLMGAKMPAILVECGFITNKTELARLKSPKYQQALARGIAASVRAYIDEY